jgi:WhiB family transcriptional regulator, redox-sensing transcriptional regulator
VVSSDTKATYTYERSVCARCPDRTECLELALCDPTLVGCWGGTDERERRELRRGSAVA